MCPFPERMSYLKNPMSKSAYQVEVLRLSPGQIPNIREVNILDIPGVLMFK